MNSAIPDNSPSQPNNTSWLPEAVSFSAKEDIPPITLGILIVLANGLVLILVSKKRQLRTITNLLLCSLAFSDLLTGMVGIPLHMTCNILRQSALCIADDQMLRFTSVSIVCHLKCGCKCGQVNQFQKFKDRSLCLYHLTISINIPFAFFLRYLAIIHSLRHKSMVTLARCVSVMLFIWILSAVMALIQLSWIDPIHHDIYKEATAELIKKEVIYDVVSLLIFFFAPLVCMVYVYVKVFSEVSRQINNIQKKSIPGWQKAKEMKNTERKVVTIFAVVLLVYAVCWLPYFLLRFFFHKSDVHPLVLYISIWLRFLTSFLHPYLYIFGKKDFREALKWGKTQKERYRIFLPLDRLGPSE